jgi:hypothetical protein
MAKAVTARKPSIKFCPSRNQYEDGVAYKRLDGIRDKITLKGYVAPTIEDEENILALMQRDKHCGIVTWEKREMPPEQRAAETETHKLRAENSRQKEEMEAMRAEMDELRKAAGKG